MVTLIEISDSERRFVFHAPATTAKGQPIQVLRDERDGVHRVHALSPDESELYFEVVAYLQHVVHGEAVAQQQRFLAEHSPDGAVTPAEATTVKSLPATTFSFRGTLGSRWKVRRFLFVDTPVRTCRIVYDLTSDLNVQVLDSLVISDDSGVSV
jgi:hypothetical protein